MPSRQSSGVHGRQDLLGFLGGVILGCGGPDVMPQTRKLAAILAADVVGYRRLASADEDRILPRLLAQRNDLIDHAIAVFLARAKKKSRVFKHFFSGREPLPSMYAALRASVERLLE